MREPGGLSLTAVDLFSGAGGLSIGLERAGFRVLAAVDSWGPAVNTHRLNFRHPILQRDVAALSAEALWSFIGSEPRELTLVAGGPPCQGFSIQRIGSNQDPRNHLVLEFARVTLELAPALFLMENVPGLLGSRGLRLAAVFERTLLTGGYLVRRAILDAADYGVPQRRRRVFYYGWHPERAGPVVLPLPSHLISEQRTVRDALGDLPSPAQPGPNAVDPLHVEGRLSDLNRERIRLIPPGGGFENLPERLRVQAHKRGAAAIGHRYVYGRLHPDRPAATITGKFDSFTRGQFGHPWEDRNLTLREGARLQTFPDTHAFKGSREDIAALIGNAVPPLLAELVGRAMVRAALRQAATEDDRLPLQLQLQNASTL